MPLNIPDCFTQSIKSGQKTYSRNPPGNLDVSALIANKPCWVSPMPVTIQSKKTLILSDWTAQAWSSEKTEQVKQALGELIDQGFSIYIAHDKQSYPINKSKLSELDFSKMTFVNPTELTQAAMTAHKLAFDQVQILDHYWLNHILSGEQEPGPHVLHTSDIPKIYDDKAPRLMEILTASAPQITKIIHDKFSMRLNSLITKLSPFQIETHYSALDLEQFSFSGPPSEVTQNGVSTVFSPEQLKNIETIFFPANISGDHLIYFIDNTPNLKTIDLSCCKLIYNLRHKLSD